MDFPVTSRCSYTWKGFKASIERMDGYMQCLAPTCKSGQIHSGGGDEPIMTCVECGFQSCYNHKLPWHSSKTCAEYDYASVGRLMEEQATREVLEKTAKICPNPNCGYHITKISGCDHMICMSRPFSSSCWYINNSLLTYHKGSRCAKHFCWLCLLDWHPLHRCN